MKKPKYYDVLVLGAHHFYQSPWDILEEADWDWDQKENLLLNWKYYIISETAFEDPQKSTHILKINQALNQLKARRNLH